MALQDNRIHTAGETMTPDELMVLEQLRGANWAAIVATIAMLFVTAMIVLATVRVTARALLPAVHSTAPAGRLHPAQEFVMASPERQPLVVVAGARHEAPFECFAAR
ncbi:MAG: hypothetical protein ABI333_04385 [bacterium]